MSKLRWFLSLWSDPGPRDPLAERCRFLILLSILALGAGSRVSQYLMRASFWHDEAFVVLNVFDKSAAELFGKLNDHQAAPPVFLLAMRGAYLTLGPSEFAMRAVPLVCGLLAPIVFAWVAWRVLPHGLALWAVGFVSLSGELIVQSVTAKQYSGDVLMASTMLGIAFAARRPASSDLRMVLLSIFAAGAIWASHPAIFVFGALAAGTWPRMWRAGPRGRIIWLLCAALVAASFLLLYLCSIRLQRDEHLQNYWTQNEGFPDFARPMTLPVWLVTRLVTLCHYPFQPLGTILIVLVPLGAVSLWRKRQFALLTALVGPIVFLLAAAVASQFPFSGSRLTLFGAPALALLGARGIGWCFQHANGWVRAAGAGLGIVLLSSCAVTATQLLFVPHIRSHIRPAVEYLRQHRGSDEAIYILGWPGRGHPFFCYWRDPSPPVALQFDPATVRAGERFWIVAGFSPKRGMREIAPALRQADDVADEIERFEVGGGAAIGYRARRPAVTMPSGAQR